MFSKEMFERFFLAWDGLYIGYTVFMSLNILQKSLIPTLLCEVIFVKEVPNEMNGSGNDFGKV